MQTHITGRTLLDMTPQQVHAMYKLRVDVFVNEQQSTFAEIDDTDAHPKTHHLLAYVHPGSGPDYPYGVADPGSPLRLVGTARIFGPPEAQHIGRLCVVPDLRGYGIAKQIIEQALEVARGRTAALDPVSQSAIVKIEAQTHVQKFYEGYGFAAVGEPFDLEGVEHVEMHLALD
ncbi:GNAT family N-acetyltransferase [Corynebacterium heidelbergense]|nr:putative acyltransferase [Corynebacterium heidelbergense]